MNYPSGKCRCSHSNVSCLNQYEIIRKYKCAQCLGVMICDCDKETGERFLSHQLGEGQESRTGLRVRVTHGFQPGICNTCRGLPEPAAPKAKMFGCTSKVQRYYWREILVRTMWRMDSEHDKSRDEVEREVIDGIKAEHEHSPKYSYAEESESQFISRIGVRYREYETLYLASPDRKARVRGKFGAVSIEDFAIEQLENEGFSVLKTESVPFHVTFGIYAWMLIQDMGDPYVRAVQFGRRDVWEATGKKEMIWCLLPEDFGKPGYAERRRVAIDEFFSKNFRADKDDLLCLFDYWLEPSLTLRQYLWAHRTEDIERAREVVRILPADKILLIVRYLLESYWERYLGWPDLLAWRRAQPVRFIEVKSAKDKLSAEQMEWIEANDSLLGFEFEVIKVRKLRP